MESNGRAMETETHTAQDTAHSVENVDKDDELEIIDDGSNPYKKVKVNVKGESKKKVTGDAEKVSERKDSEIGDTNKGDEESEAMKNLVQDIRKKKKKSKKKEKSEDDAEESREKEKKKKSEKKEGSKKKKDTEASGENEGEEKEKKKKKKKKEKEEDDEKEKKKKKKKKESSAEDQDAKEKERKKKKKKEKALEAYQKKFQEFEKKYPQYIQKGKIKFPIDDVLFKLYDTILSEHLPKTKKPVPKNGLIPSNELGDILQIWNFYESFPELFTFKDIPQEEIYACLKYEGDEHLYLIDSLHQEILIFFVKDFIKKNKFETFKDEIENPFFVLVKYYAGYEGPQSSELLLIWTELLRKLSNTLPFTEQLSLTTKKYIENLAESSTLNYNKIEYKIKIRVMLELINLSYESETFRDCLQEKMDQATGLGREKNELLQEIKQEEQEYYDLKAKVEVSEKAQKEEEEKWEQLSRTEVLKRQKDFENEKKEFQKTLAALAKVEASLQKKRKRVEEILLSTNVTIDTANRLGVDGNKSEYWVFTGQPERLYVKMSPLIYTEDAWRYFDQQEEVDQLQEALNTKGIKEKHLYDKIREAIANKHLDLKTSKTEGEKAEEKKDEADINFWYAKVLDFTPASDLPDEQAEQVRTTRTRAHDQAPEKAQRKRPRDLKYLTLDGVKEILDNVESHLTEYLAKWNARWAHPRIKEELKRKIKEATTVKELAGLLLELEKNFQYSETPLRQKTMEEEANPDEAEQDDYEDRSEEEDDEGEGDESNVEDRSDGEEQYYGDHDKKDRRKSKKKGDREDEEEDEGNEDEENEEEKSEEERRKMEEDENKEDLRSENKMETEEGHEKKEEGKENGVAGETEPQEKVKKMSLKIWGRVNERIRRCWVAFTKDVDNITGLFLCASIFTEFVENYLEKKRIKYFTEYDNIAQYMAAKRERKQNVAADRATAHKKQNSQHSLEKLKRDREIRRQNYTLTRYAAQHTRGGDRDREEQLSDSPERPIKKKAGYNREPPAEAHSHHLKPESGPKRIRKLRDQSSDRSESEAEYEYNPKSEEKAKTKQEKLNELANVRRSTRVTRRTRMSEEVEDEEEEYQEEKDCATCGRPGGDQVKCTMCESAYHLDCIGLKKMPDDKWTCFSCLQKLVSQRQTRSTTRRLH